jgi:cytoskeletal protein CcmA (bactofilin family)
MWKQKPESVSSPVLIPAPEPVPSPVPAPSGDVRARVAQTGVEQATITKGIVVRGVISGTDPLYVDGTVEGSIHIPGERVIIGRNGHVTAAKDPVGPCIAAGEIVIMGVVTGSILAGDRVDLKAHATLAGDVSTARVSIEDGAYFRGGIDIRRDDKPAGAPPAPASAAASSPEAQPAEAVQV